MTPKLLGEAQYVFCHARLAQRLILLPARFFCLLHVFALDSLLDAAELETKM